MFFKKYSIVLVSLFITSCGNLPKPFQQDHVEKSHNELIKPDFKFDVVIQGIDGAKPGDELLASKVMAYALEEKEYLVDHNKHHNAQYILNGYVEKKSIGNQKSEISLTWALKEPLKKETINFKQTIVVEDIFWNKESTTFLTKLTSYSSKEVLKKLKEKNYKKIAAKRVEEQQVKSTPSPEKAEISGKVQDVKQGRRVFFAGFNGVPEKGKLPLRRSTEDALKKIGVHVSKESEAAFPLFCNIDLKDIDEDKQFVKITWTLFTPDRKQKLANIVQKNNIQKGSLDKIWNDVVFYIAQGAAEGVKDAFVKIENKIVYTEKKH